MAFYNEFSDTTNFVISFTHNPRGDFGVFAKGYTQAAESLAQTLLEAPRFSDYEAYPVVFLYRHALELSLKNVIYACLKVAAFRRSEDAQRSLQYSHDVRLLSNTAASLLKRVIPHDPELHKVFRRVQQTAAEFMDIDPGSYAYRYPVDKQGRHSTPHHQIANLRAISQTMSCILNDLATIHFGLNIEVDIAENDFVAIEDLLESVIRDLA